MYYDLAVGNKLLVGLSAINSQQAAATQRTDESIDQILDYCATYPSDGILYRYSDMVLSAHSDAGFHNESKGHSRSREHTFLSENDAMPRWNRPVLTLAKIIKFVMSSDSESELSTMFITAQEMMAMRQTWQEMKWPQQKSPLQTDNSAAAGVVNNTIVPRKLKKIDRRLHWLIYREAQGQFCYYCTSGNLNWGCYSTKHHPPPLSRIKNNEIFRESKQLQRHQVPVRFQQGYAVPSSRWYLLLPGTLTRRARTAK